MTATQIIEKIASTLETNVQDGQLVLSDTIVDSVPLGKLLDLLDTGASSLGISNVSITKADHIVTVAGQSSLLGADNIALEAIFTDNNSIVSFGLSAKNLPNCHIPGCPWLALKQAQIALQITGDTHDVTGTINGTIHAGNMDIAAVFSVAKTADSVVLNWTIAEINLSQITTVFLNNTSVPPELPSFSFKDVKTTLTPKTGAFAFEVTSVDTWNFPANGGGLSITEVKLNLERENRDSQTHCAIAISSSTATDIVEGLAIEDFQLDFDFQGQEWSVTGNIDAIIADAKTSLKAAYTQKEAGKTLTLTAHSAMKPLNLGDIGSLSLSTLELEFTKPASSEENQPAKLEWSVSAEGAISIPGAIECAGKLSIYRHEKTAGLEFQPDQAKFTIPLPHDQKSSLELDFDSLSLVRKTIDSNTQEWTLDAKVDLNFAGLNSTVQKYLPNTIPMQFKADQKSVSLLVDGTIETIQFVIPNVDIPSLGELVLGTAQISISTLDITLGQNIELSAVMGVGLPSQLNNLFGVKKDNNGELSPSVEIFRTFDPQDPEHSTVQLELGITVAGIKVAPKTSFIKAIELVNEDGKTSWHGDFGEYGAISVDVPEFTYSATSSAFAASGGFSMDKDRPLALPLSPIKHLLDACKLSGAAKMLPDALPLSNVKIDANNLVDKLVEMLDSLLQKTGGGQISDEARKVLNTIAKNFDKLPASFIEYLDVQIPQSFNFEMAVTPTGAVRFDAGVKEGDPPIKLLFPGFMGISPVLNGITISSISFGEIAGGSLILLKMDADIDQFDLATLAAALVLPDNTVLPNTQNLQRRLKLNELYMVLPTTLPIPIPLFYDNVGIEYLGLEGLTLQAHAQFPLPKPSLKALGELLSDFKQFFTDSNYRLDPQKPPQGLNPEFFSLHQNSLQLPKYLGGKMLAPQKDPTIDYAAIANLLNGMKFLTINDLIQAIPLSDRIGDVDAAFGPISAQFGWLVTTPDEFKQLPSNPTLQKIAYQKLGLSGNAQANDILTVLPPAQTGGHSDEQGLIAFLKIGWKVANVTTFDTAFGLAASGSMGFNTGFKLTGSIANFVDVKLAGAIAIKGKPAAAQTPSEIPDFTALTFNGQNQYVKLGNPEALNFSGQITIAAWIKPTASDGIRNIVAHGYNPTPAGEVFLRIVDGQYQIGSWDGNSYFAAATMPVSDLGTWVHLAGVYDGAWKLYRNGVLLNTQAILIDRPAVPHSDVSRPAIPHTDTTSLFGQPTRNPFPKPTVHVDIPSQAAMHMDVPGQQAVQIALPNKGVFPVQSDWAIGSRGTGTERFFQGQIAQVHIWNRARSQAEIQAEMVQPLNSNEPGLVGNWALDEGSGNVVGDRSINNINGTIQGAQWSKPSVQANDAFRLNGSSLLTIPILNNHQLFKGDVQVTDKAFAFKGTLALFPPASPLQVGGTVEGSLSQNAFFLSGKVATTLAGFVLTEATATISNHQIFVKGTWLGFSALLDVQMANQALQMRGQIGFNAGIRANIGPLTEPSTGLVIVQSIPLNVALNGNLDTTISYIGNIASFSGGVNGSFIWNNTSLKLPSGLTFHSAPVSVDDLKNQLVVYIQSQASGLFNSFFNTPYKAFKAGYDGVVTLANNLQPALSAARSWSATAWNSVSAWSTQAWKSSYQWRATAWSATTRWSDTAWQSTTRWTDTAWQSTTRWSDDAWNATTQWSDDAWKATTAWSDAAWNATASWSKETWKASTTWTSKVWNSTKNWTVSQFQNPLQTLKDLFHIDSTIPRVNVVFPPHGDTTKVPHVDSSGKHTDTSKLGFHIDSTPHFDTPRIHIDTPGVHTDTPAFHTDTPGL